MGKPKKSKKQNKKTIHKTDHAPKRRDNKKNREQLVNNIILIQKKIAEENFSKVK